METLLYLYALYYELIICNKQRSVSKSNASLKPGPFQSTAGFSLGQYNQAPTLWETTCNKAASLSARL